MWIAAIAEVSPTLSQIYANNAIKYVQSALESLIPNESLVQMDVYYQRLVLHAVQSVKQDTGLTSPIKYVFHAIRAAKLVNLVKLNLNVYHVK